MKQIKDEDILVTYDVAHRIAGHRKNKDVKLVEAVKDIFSLVKEKSMQVAIKGVFVQFETIQELTTRIKVAAIEGVSVRVHDENVGG